MLFRFPELKKELCGGGFWTSGYYPAIIRGRENWLVVEKHVKNQ